MYLFDTDIVSDLMRGAPSAVLLRRVAMTSPTHQFTSAVTVGELAYGAHRSNRAEYFLRKLDEQVLSVLTVLPFERDAAGRYGQIRVELERAGTPLPEPDLRIAAIALVRRLTLVTGNIRHFAQVPGLTVENWLAG